jgi:hypothetical protein
MNFCWVDMWVCLKIVVTTVIGVLALNNYQLLDEVEQNVVICRWRADRLFADAEGRGK